MLSRYKRIALPFIGFALLAGCASTDVTESKQFVEKGTIDRPGRIIVYNFSATASEVPAESALSGRVAEHGTPQTAKDIEVGRKLGALVAEELVANIRKMGLPAVRAANQPPPKVGNAVIKGHFISLDEGSAAERVLVGFGTGSAELKTVVEGYQVTATGLRPLGSREIKSGGNKLPGVVAPAIVVAATHNPVGLIVGGAAKLAGEGTGKATIEGAAKRTAEEISEELETAFKAQGWI